MGIQRPNLVAQVHKTKTSCRPDSVAVPGGKALIGTARPLIQGDGEGPLRQKKVKPFRMKTTTVSNAEFAEFIAATGYITEAEQFGWSFVFHSDVPKSIGKTRSAPGTSWWRMVEGATWRDLNGPKTGEVAWHEDHPVVQVSWNDAVAYAEWCGGRLPSEVEWEHAARGGLGDVPFPWGDKEPDDDTFLPCNIWQGRFPTHNTGADGWKNTSPVNAFEPNAYGLFNMVGNVWEWTSDPFRIPSLKKKTKDRLAAMKGFKLLKGGSFLCHRSYCYRYRVAARIGNSPDTTTPHQGFRVVWGEV
ncbi:formylglycine-generating enzyme family protein [Octadecabacter temperatus]|uniref:formylglycine-generating enzyme family protein n=1 Tax=Octadecabacter temperatus TaxID=1458307 RepID=UPI003CC7DF30